MISIIYNLSPKAPKFDAKEALRYAGVRSDDVWSLDFLNLCARELLPHLDYRICYREISLDEKFASDVMGSSESLKRAFFGCSSMMVLAATVGGAPDFLVRRASYSEPAKTVFYQAIGTERIEALLDDFCADTKKRLAERGMCPTPRFSPGYGDLSLEWQRDIFALLDCPRQIGLTLGESLFMIPTKSVTALIGIKDAR
jgi:hypothetical protein